MAKSIRKNYIYNACYEVLLLITPLIVTPYLSRILKPDGIGTVSYAESIVSYFAFFSAMGVTTYGQREISYVRDDINARSAVFWDTKILEFITSAVTACAYLVFSLFQKENRIIYLILSLNLLSVFFDITWFFKGLEEFGKITGRNAFFRCLQIVFCFLFIKEKEDLPLYVLSLGLCSALGNISLWLYLPKYVRRVPRQKIHPFKDIRTVWSLFIPTIAIEIYTVLDKTMIGLITGDPFENGYYEQSIKISKVLSVLVTALGKVMGSRIGYYYGNGNQAEIQRLMYQAYRFVWFLGVPLCLGTVMVAGNFVPWFFGDGYGKVTQLLHVTPLLILAIGFNNVTGNQYLIPIKRQNTYTRTVLIGAAVNFTLNSVLIYYFGAFGAAIASVAAETTIAIVQLIIVRRELSPWRVLKEGIHYYIAGFIMLLALLPLGNILSPSVLHTAIMVVIGAAVYFLVLLLERDEFFLSNLRKMVRR